jgi:hypothetical protein
MVATRPAGVVVLLVSLLTSLPPGRIVAAEPAPARGDVLIADPSPVEWQPLAANADRLIDALEFLGRPGFDPNRYRSIRGWRKSAELMTELDREVALVVELTSDGPHLYRGDSQLLLQHGGYVPLVVKIVNRTGSTEPIRWSSSLSGPVYAGESEGSLKRQNQTQLKSDLKDRADPTRYLDLEWFASQPMTPAPRGLPIEYGLLLVYAGTSGRLENTWRIDHAGKTGELRENVEVVAAVPVKLRVRDVDAAPTIGRFTFRDASGHVHPPQPKRLAPDFFFQQQVYRRDGEEVLLAPGEYTVEYCRGPEYKRLTRRFTVPKSYASPRRPFELAFQLERWIDPLKHGFYSGDHHIHAAGCAHYTVPTEGVHDRDMFRQIKGEGLNVGSVLTWGPCFDYQRQFFSPLADPVSEPLTLLKYDIEVSGFGSAALGHVCLLNLRDYKYPGSNGTVRGWPTWTTPVLRWTKAQGGYTGYAHSASGLAIDPTAAAGRQLAALDADADKHLSDSEAAAGLLVEPTKASDSDGDGRLTLAELTAAHARAADRLPNLAIPEMNGSGAMEIAVTAAHGVCDFISAMDTERIQEWNTWYHLMNCGLPVKVSGETDFPCMSSTRVGQGRVYVRLGPREKLNYAEWCRGLAEGRSYVSDGYAHAPDFTIDGRRYGETVELREAGEVEVAAVVAFGSQTPAGVPYGNVPTGGRRQVGDTRVTYEAAKPQPSDRLVEVVVNGQVVASKTVPADDAEHRLTFRVPIDRSSWVAVRQFPQLHTNPINVTVAGRPIRASRPSALWCIGTIEQLWRTREKAIAPAEREEARQTFNAAKEIYRKIAAESH